MTTRWFARDCAECLNLRPNWEVVAEVANGKDAISRAVETSPDIAVLDYSLPLVNGIEVTARFGPGCPRPKSSFSRCTTAKRSFKIS